MTFEELERYSNNPARAITRIFQDVESAIENGGGVINAAGHPFSYVVDLIVGTQYNFIVRNGDNAAKTYPVHARTIADLAKVMSDDDWQGVFSEPSMCTFRWNIAEEELNKIAIEYTDVSGTAVNNYRKLVLPPDAKFTVAGIPYLLENPVEIRVMEHGGTQVVYDSSYQSPLRPLVTNAPDKEPIDQNGRRYLSIHLPIRQLAVKEHTGMPVNASTGFRQTFDFTDKLYAIRAFITPDGGTERQEMSVVFNNEIFDPNQPTLTVDLIDGTKFEASIPSVYLQNGTGLGRLSLLIYTTRGQMNQDLSTLRTKENTVVYFDYRNQGGKLGKYSIPLRSVNDVTVDVITPIQGGLNGADFQQLKNMKIYGHRRRQIPISNNDLTQTFQDQGYDLIKSIDFVTDRLYRTTRDLPIQESKLFEDDSVARFNSSIGTYTGSYLTSIEDLVGSGNVIDNGKRVSIHRGSVFDITEQTCRLIPRHEVEQLKKATNQVKIDITGLNSMVYTPFLYVIDTTNNRASVRTYRIDHPEIRYQTFRYENPGLGLEVSVGGITMSATEQGYVIQVKTKSSPDYQKLPDDQVGIQLSFNTIGSSTPATMRGKLLGKSEDKERVWQFTIPSRFDLDDLDQIDLGGFNQFGRPQDQIRTKLNEVANFIFTFAGDGQVVRSASDMKVDQSLFDRVNVAIIETEYATTFGKRLGAMYSRIRPIVGPASYAKYTDNVPAVYTEDLYKYENEKLVVVNGKAVLEHRAGEPRYNADGSPVWAHEKGTTVYDDKGQPVLLAPRILKYHWDFIGFDFNYILSQDEYDQTYVELVENFFANEVNDWLTEMNKISLDETLILFKPRSTMGFTQVILNEAIEKTIRTDIGLTVTYYLTDEGMTDAALKKALTSNTHRVANEHLRRSTFSTSELTKVLKTADTMGVKITAAAGVDQVDVITNIDNTNGFSVRKTLDQTSDRLLTIKESIEILFKRHLPRQ